MKKIVVIISSMILCYYNISQAKFISYISSNTSYLSANPIVIQSIQSSQLNTVITQALNLNYAKSMASPALTVKWQHNLTSPVSEPVYVGRPDFPFPDRWPWTHDVRAPPENNATAQKYSSFQKANIQRTPIVYQIDGRHILYGFDLKTGQPVVKLNLTELLSVDLFSNVERRENTEPQIIMGDVFINNSWHTLLVAVVGDKRQTIFCLDVTYPFLLTTKSAKNQLWWKKTDSRGYLSRPTIIRTIDGYWSILFAQAGCLDDEFVAGMIKLCSLQTGSDVAEIILPAFTTNLGFSPQARDPIPETSLQVMVNNKFKNSQYFVEKSRKDKQFQITEIPDFFKESSAKTKGNKTDMARCQNHIQFTQMSPIDSKGRGYVDYLYMGDNYGTIWKFDLTAKMPKQWGLVKQAKGNIKNRMGIFSMIENNQYGKIFSQPKVISHPDGDGVLICFGVQPQKEQNNYVVSIYDNEQHNYLFSDMHDVAVDYSENWYVKNQHVLSTPVIRNRRVLTILPGNKAAVLDVKDGRTYAKSPYIFIKSSNNNNMVYDADKSLNFIGAPLIFQGEASEPNIVLHALENGDFAWAKIDIENDRLGRRVWRELNE